MMPCEFEPNERLEQLLYALREMTKLCSELDDRDPLAEILRRKIVFVGEEINQFCIDMRPRQSKEGER